MNELEKKSQELKDVLKVYDTQWFLGHLSFLMTCIANGTAKEELSKLSSPMRQLYFLGGLVMTGKESDEHQIQYTDEEWKHIVNLLNDIENEYFKLFVSKEGEEITDEWKKKRKIAMPSFLSYFNQGPLNYEEQSISWIKEVYSSLDTIISQKLNLTIADFLTYYENVDKWCQNNFQMFSLTNPQNYPMRKNWHEYTNTPTIINEDAPEFIKEKMVNQLPQMTFVYDYGIKMRFRITDIISEDLNFEKAEQITSLLSCKREDSEFLFYTATNPGNPLYSTPIIQISDDMYQVFEEKQILHAIESLLNDTCSSDKDSDTKLNTKKGDVLENQIEDLCHRFFGKGAKIYRGYYIDGCEQDILVLWKKYAFIIEAKNYKKKEPFRDPEKAYKRIKQEFDKSIGYAFTQCKRVNKYFCQKATLNICDKNGKTIDSIDTANYYDNDFSIIINVSSFGQIQTDLSYLLKLEENDRYPWAIKYDDFEVFLLTLIQKRKNPYFLVDFLIMREYMHEHLICSDELEVCGGYLTGNITDEIAKNESVNICTTPILANVFDEQYRKGMGFKNEKYWKEKHDGKTIFW